MTSYYKLFTPGPTQVPHQVLESIAKPTIYHRSDEFKQIYFKTVDRLKYIFQTKHTLVILTCSGTGALESTVVNLFSPGDTLVVINNGKFSGRWVDIIRTYGMNVEEIKLDWGKSPDPEQIKNILNSHPEIKGVYLTHCETSSGAFTDIKIMSAIIHENSDALVCIDGVSSIGALEFYFDDWGIDAAVTASQKALMCPPGLACTALSDRAVKRLTSSRQAKFYFDLKEAIKAGEMGTTPWTPAVSLISGLETATRILENEKIENVWKRHANLGKLARSGVESLGFKIFPQHPSDSVTVFSVPDFFNVNNFLENLKVKKHIILSRGQGEFRDKLIRIGHMGYYYEEDINNLLNSIKEVLSE